MLFFAISSDDDADDYESTDDSSDQSHANPNGDDDE